MSDKTCGECLYYDAPFCNYHEMKVASTRKSCVLFDSKEKPPTNGDVIRQMSNKNLAIFLGDRVYCFTCPTKGLPCFDKPKDVCYQKWFDWLNAPAESEGEE